MERIKDGWGEGKGVEGGGAGAIITMDVHVYSEWPPTSFPRA